MKDIINIKLYSLGGEKYFRYKNNWYNIEERHLKRNRIINNKNCHVYRLSDFWDKIIRILDTKHHLVIYDGTFWFQGDL